MLTTADAESKYTSESLIVETFLLIFLDENVDSVDAAFDDTSTASHAHCPARAAFPNGALFFAGFCQISLLSPRKLTVFPIGALFFAGFC